MEWLKALVVAGGLALAIRWSIGEPFRIPSGSMEPTLHGDPGFLKGDRVFVNKFVYGLRWPLNHARIPFTDIVLNYANDRIFHWQEPQRFDIVVFKTVEKDAKHRTLVKRIIGLPGERIHIANGKIHVNGEPLELPPEMSDVTYTNHTYGPEGFKYGVLETDAYSCVPEGHYLLLGDNSAHSRDGRVWGWMPNEHLLGRVSCVWWPISSWQDFTGFSRTWWWRTIVAVLGILLFVRLFLGRSWRVRDEAIGTPLARGHHLYVNRAAFGLPIPFVGMRLFRGRIPNRGELVVYEGPAENGEDSDLHLGIVAGLPGERVSLDNGTLTIDNEAVTEPDFLAGRTFKSADGAAKYGVSKGKQYSVVPADHYFILVDDPEAGPDSRTLGWIPYDALVGPATAVWWPLTRVRRLRT
jgi:signal peptidase I